MPEPDEHGRPDEEISGVLVVALVRYVRRLLGEEAAHDLVARSGVTGDDGRVHRDRWYPATRVAKLTALARTACGDPDLGWRMGEELARNFRTFGLHDFLLEQGSAERAFDVVTAYGSKMSSTRLYTPIEQVDGHVLIDGRYGVVPADDFFCRMFAGFAATVPGLFGAVGVAGELECQVRGDERCLFRVAWTTPEGGTATSAAAGMTGTAAVQQFEELQAMASQLALAPDVNTTLEHVITSVGGAAMAPRYLLAVRLRDDDALRLHHRGFRAGDAEARACAEALLRGEPDPGGGTPLVVDVVGTRRYGVLCALFAPGTVVDDEIDRRLLAAYAGHAAAALETAHALERARQDRDTAHALLDVSRMLGGARSSDDVAAVVARTISALTDTPHASVWLLDDARQVVTFAAGSDRDGTGEAIPAALPYADVPGLATLRELRRSLVAPAEDAPPVVRRMLDVVDARTLVVTPIVARGDLLGIVAAGFASAGDVAPLTLERMEGVADQAAVALDNVRLLEQVRYGALHDALTDLPNRTLASDCAEEALRRAAADGDGVALLFVDLDGFKQVNDGFGHRAGDTVLAEVADRFRACIRPADLLARLAGDEFLAILPGAADAREAADVAQRLLDALHTPFVIDGRSVEISASIGIARAPEHGEDYETLLQLADAAMYRAKATGRDRFVHAHASTSIL
ncbi:MAG TPA: diguanylate cyclase [Acidimicrobiia bacterium]|nr:diguanylate cyclase [Acidimicrobiia bacterium]